MQISNLHPHQTDIVETPTITISSYTRDLIEDFSSGKILTDKGGIYSIETIRSYNYFLNSWQSFEDSKGFQINFKQMFPVLVREYTTFLQTEGKSKNSISLILSKLKAVLKFAFMEGLTFWNGSGIKTPKELTTKVYLSFNELKVMKQTEVTQGQKNVLNVFFIQCFTGLRYSTLMKFLQNPASYIKEHEGKSYIDITSDKTDEQSIIPLGETVKEILQESEGENLIFTEEYVNRTLKIIAAKSGLSNPVTIRITKGGKMQEEMKEKHNLISTHTARRSLISLAKQSNMTDREILGITGHKTEAQLNEYNRSTNLEKVKGILGNDFFDTKL